MSIKYVSSDQTSIEALGLSTRDMNGLRNSEVRTIGDLWGALADWRRRTHLGDRGHQHVVAALSEWEAAKSA
jgi:hypothetical protein